MRVALPPLITTLGPTLKLTVGNGAFTDTVVDWTAVPPGPTHVNRYVSLCVRAPVDWAPLTALAPDQPPEAVQVVASAEVHVRVELPPEAMVLGLAVMLTAGAVEATVIVAD